MPTFSLHTRAVRKIKKGEEITISYCNTFESAKERQKGLDPYGFKCTGPAVGKR